MFKIICLPELLLYIIQSDTKVMGHRKKIMYKVLFVLNFLKRVSKPKATEILVINGYSKRHLNFNIILTYHISSDTARSA